MSIDLATVSEVALEAHARHAARRVGLVAHKSKWRRDSIDNRGGFMLIDPYWNFQYAGFRFDLTAAEVIEYCKPD